MHLVNRHISLPFRPLGDTALKNFRSLVVLKRPQHELWSVMRDHLVDFAGSIADIEEIRQIERTADSDGIVHIVNEWRVRQQIPAAIRSMLKIGEVGWIDRNTLECRNRHLFLDDRAQFPWRLHRLLRRDHVRRGHGRSGHPRHLCRRTRSQARSARFAGKHGADGVGLCRIHRDHDHSAQSARRGRGGGGIRTGAMMGIATLNPSYACAAMRSDSVGRVERSDTHRPASQCHPSRSARCGENQAADRRAVTATVNSSAAPASGCGCAPRRPGNHRS